MSSSKGNLPSHGLHRMWAGRMNIFDRKSGTLVIFDDDAVLTSEVTSADIAQVRDIINVRVK